MFNYKTSENTQISFSGGRTSAFLLRQALDGNGGVLPENFAVIFANTGKERPETLDFIHEIETRWEVPITWLEWQPFTGKTDKGRRIYPDGKAHRIVNYETASRNGEPFEALIDIKGFPPNPIMRHCTGLLKEETMRSYIKNDKKWDEWETWVGIRHDEPRRFKIEGRISKREELVLPLRWQKISEDDVMKFWAEQDFDLRLKQYEGNCDLCFLKSSWKRAAIIRDNPSRADWWIKMEKKFGKVFREGKPYEVQKMNSTRQPELFSLISDDDDLGGCRCHD